MKIILPGGAGLVGQNLVVQLKESGDSEIVVIDNHLANVKIMKELHPEVEIIEGDLAVLGEWQHSLKDADIVVMLQAQIGSKNIQDFRLNNIDSTNNILDTMRSFNVPYLVHISSSVVESVADDYYTNTKKEQEQCVVNSGIDSVILRPTLMFGWFDRKHLGWLSNFMKKVPVFPIPGNGRYMRQPLYVKDFCDIILSCIDKKPVGKAYNITGYHKIDYIDIIHAIKNTIEAKTWIVKIPYGLFYFLLWFWSLFDRNPPFTTQQLSALVADDEFEIIDWPDIFGVKSTPFRTAIEETFNHPEYSKINLKF